MRLLGFGVLAALVSTPAIADEFASRIERINANHAAIEQSMRKLGVPSTSGPKGLNPERSEGKPSHLYQVHGDLSELRLAQGRMLFGSVHTRLVVGSEGSPSVIEIEEGQGAFSGERLLGVARQGGTPGRLVIEIQKLVLRSGRVIPVQATALDDQGAFGLSAQVVSQKALAVAGAMTSSFISGLAAAQQTQTTNAFGFQQTQTTGRNAILQGVAQTAADQSKRLIEEATSEKPILIVEAGTPVTVLIQDEVRY